VAALRPQVGFSPLALGVLPRGKEDLNRLWSSVPFIFIRSRQTPKRTPELTPERP